MYLEGTLWKEYIHKGEIHMKETYTRRGDIGMERPRGYIHRGDIDKKGYTCGRRHTHGGEIYII